MAVFVAIAAICALNHMYDNPVEPCPGREASQELIGGYNGRGDMRLRILTSVVSMWWCHSVLQSEK